MQPPANGWSLPPCPPAVAASASACSSALYAVGGQRLLLASSVEAYDPATDQWTAVASMLTRRANRRWRARGQAVRGRWD